MEERPESRRERMETLKNVDNNVYIVCRGIKKYLGLMFKIKSPNLIFIFEKPTLQPIHSFFCRTFRARWYDWKGELIDEKIVKPFFWDIKPSHPFCFLVETLVS